MDLDELREELQRKTASAERILDACSGFDIETWQRDPGLCLDLIKWLIRQGIPGRALELAKCCEKILADNDELRYQLALAAARGGNPGYAEELLKKLLEKAKFQDREPSRSWSTRFRVEIYALQARVLKDQSRRILELAAKSAEWYEEAANLPRAQELPDRATFPLINAATMWRISGDVPRSQELARSVIERIADLADTELAVGNMWPAATLGEAHLLLGNHTESVRWYQAAANLANRLGNVGDLASMRNNIRRLQQVDATASGDFLDEHLGKVVVFCGHMVDSPPRHKLGLADRFPHDPRLLDRVKAAIQQTLAALNAKVGYSSLACGGDLIFAEAMLERGGELHVVLPYDQDDFLRTSVDFGLDGPPWTQWRARYERVVQQVKQQSIDHFRYTTSEPFLNSPDLYEFAFEVLQGRAVLRANERVSDPIALILQEGTTASQASFPAMFHARWQAAGLETQVIDLKAIRADLLREQGRAADAERLLGDAIQPASGYSQPRAKVQRTIKTMLFADVAGYSSIKEATLADFLVCYGDYLHQLFNSPVGQNVLYANTWGDGLYVVFNDVRHAAEFGLELVEPTMVHPPRWSDYGLSNNPFRVGMHRGPVFELPDIFQGRACYSGQHVTRAARIEPVTLPGCVYASESLAASLIMASRNRFQVERVGAHALAKGYDDRCDLFRIAR